MPRSTHKIPENIDFAAQELLGAPEADRLNAVIGRGKIAASLPVSPDRSYEASQERDE